MGTEGVVVGTGGGGTAGGAGASAAFGAPIGTVLSGTCMIPLRYASAHRITVFTYVSELL